ncbi:MAG TPA: hypothetical protein VD694_05685, partial [Nitrososphaeraceae archaeon]|nr:hypothetical protein [Nitrososphaeraceae archaeon]
STLTNYRSLALTFLSSPLTNPAELSHVFLSGLHIEPPLKQCAVLGLSASTVFQIATAIVAPTSISDADKQK